MGSISKHFALRNPLCYWAQSSLLVLARRSLPYWKAVTDLGKLVCFLL